MLCSRYKDSIFMMSTESNLIKRISWKVRIEGLQKVNWNIDKRVNRHRRFNINDCGFETNAYQTLSRR